VNTGWTAEDVPDQSGRVAIVTGANSGLGLEIAAVLAQRGAHVVLAVRNLDRGDAARAEIKRRSDNADVEVQALDLASLGSVKSAAQQLKSRYPAIDLLINNAGVMWTPATAKTADGFEMQFGTNHLGHFAFTGLLLDALLCVRHSRVVTMSSFAHVAGRINFDDLNGERKYSRRVAYRQSKLANLMFTYELARRLSIADAATIAVGAHPGTSSSQLVQHAPSAVRAIGNRLIPLLTQSPAMGALPALRAATDPGVSNSQYYGPGRKLGTRGEPMLAPSNARSRDETTQRRLWAVSEQLTGVTFSV
jgi:NAD(P)-dependent dehydrogenase (short-subunit alcohol dehydrogenase family)